ncbi:MAG: sugar glycosyltransferase [Plesiomonas sp.]|uniref:sugar glycosyltransferase n=1 Tax=Plesiomonas sp. TaxID=2486279 RepID=UPI003F3D25B3
MGLLKQLYRYTRSRAYRHNENYWPALTITREKSGEISTLTYQGQIVTLQSVTSIKNCANSVLIVATGPSIKKTHFDENRYDAIIAVNGAYLLSDRIKLTHYVIVDQDFIIKKKEIVEKAIQNKDLILITTVICFWRIKENINTQIKCKLIIIEDITEKVYQKKTNLALLANKLNDYIKVDGECGFSLDIRKGIVDGGTVAYWAMQIAYFMGAKKITFAGLDMNNFHQPRFYETKESKQPTTLGENLHHKIIPSFKLASCIMKEKNIITLNLSIDSAIPNDIIKKHKVK